MPVTAQSAPFYAQWPRRPGTDFETLQAAQEALLGALRGWYREEGQDLTLFEGFSLGWIHHYDTVQRMMRLFRRAAQGADPDSDGFWHDPLDEKSSGTLALTSDEFRRADAKARLFRVFVGAARGARMGGGVGSPILALGSPSNRALWRFWSASRMDRAAVRLDIFFAYPPGFANAVRAVLHGAQVFDPAAVTLTADQARRVAEMRRRLQRLPETEGIRRLFQFRGADLRARFVERILTPFCGRLEALAVRCLSIEREFDRLGTAAVVSPSDIAIDARILRTVCRKRGAEFILLNHGFPGGGYHFEVCALGGDLDVDRVLAWGPQDAENYRAAGVSAEHVTVTGNPAFDEFLPAQSPAPGVVVHDAQVLVVAHSTAAGARTLYYDDSEERYFLETCALLHRLGAAEVIYKLHPGKPLRGFYARLLAGRRFASVVRIEQDGAFRGFLGRCRFVIGPPSTAMFEALLCGRPYFLVSYDPMPIPPPFEIERPFVAKTADELERNLTSGTCVPREAALRDFCGLLPDDKDPFLSTKKVFAYLRDRCGTTRGRRGGL